MQAYGQVTVMDMMDAREARCMMQQTLLARYPGAALVCLTMNIAGPVKNTPLIRRAFAWGKAQTFTYSYAYEDEETTGKMNYNQSKVTYIPSLQKDACVLISVNYYPEEETYLTEEELAAVMEAALSSMEMVEK